MATLHLMVGLPCSGKTTVARELEAQYSALRLTTDEWHISLFGDDFADMDDPGHERHNVRHQILEALLWGVAARALVLGTNVVLDFGCWSRSEREDFRRRTRKVGADFQIHFTDASEETLLGRLAARNVEHPDGTFRIAEYELKEWIGLFERPTQDELNRS